MSTERAFWPVVPQAAPRQVRSDGWAPRAQVLRYRAFRDEVSIRRVWAPAPRDLVVFCMPIPRSRKNVELYDGQPHEQKPDLDNLVKALLDACYGDDAHVWTLTAAKVWSTRPGIYIERAPAGPVEIPFLLSTFDRTAV